MRNASNTPSNTHFSTHSLWFVEIHMRSTKFIWDPHDLVGPMWILTNQRECVKKCVLKGVLLTFLYIYIFEYFQVMCVILLFLTWPRAWFDLGNMNNSCITIIMVPNTRVVLNILWVLGRGWEKGRNNGNFWAYFWLDALNAHSHSVFFFFLQFVFTLTHGFTGLFVVVNVLGCVFFIPLMHYIVVSPRYRFFCGLLVRQMPHRSCTFWVFLIYFLFWL